MDLIHADDGRPNAPAGAQPSARRWIGACLIALLVGVGTLSARTAQAQAQVADLQISAADAPDPVTAGGALTYSVTVVNLGPDLADAIAWSGVLPPGTTFSSLSAPGGWSCATPAVGSGGAVSCSVAAMAVGAGASFSLAVNAGAGIAAGATLAYTVSVGAASFDPIPADNMATASTQVVGVADLAISKTDGIATATPGGSLTYTIVVTNLGPGDAVAATVTDSLPGVLTGAGWTCVGAGGGTCTASGGGSIADTISLPVGGSATYALTATVAPGTVGTLTNTAAVTPGPGSIDPVPGNNSATDTDTLAAALVATAIPTLSGAGLLLLAVLTGLAGYWQVRRRSP